MKLALPMAVVKRAIDHAMENLTVERCGWFVYYRGHNQGEGGNSVNFQFVPAPNISKTPHRSAEVDSEWIAKMIVEDGYTPVRFFHSHPSGDPQPSDHDYTQFPVHYVDAAFVWSWRSPRTLTQYDARPGFFELVSLGGVEVNV